MSVASGGELNPTDMCMKLPVLFVGEFAQRGDAWRGSVGTY